MNTNLTHTQPPKKQKMKLCLQGLFMEKPNVKFCRVLFPSKRAFETIHCSEKGRFICMKEGDMAFQSCSIFIQCLLMSSPMSLGTSLFQNATCKRGFTEVKGGCYRMMSKVCQNNYFLFSNGTLLCCADPHELGGCNVLCC